MAHFCPLLDLGGETVALLACDLVHIMTMAVDAVEQGCDTSYGIADLAYAKRKLCGVHMESSMEIPHSMHVLCRMDVEWAWNNSAKCSVHSELLE